jgi:CS domain
MFQKAKTHLETAKQLGPEGKMYARWLQKAEAEIAKMPKAISVPKETTAAEKAAQARMQPAEELHIPDAPKPVLRFDWYQSLTHVNIDIYTRDCTAETAPVDIHEDMVHITAQLGEGREHQQHWCLWSKILPDESKVDYLKPKISIHLKKTKQEKWKDLEGDGSGVGTPAGLLDDSMRFKREFEREREMREI